MAFDIRLSTNITFLSPFYFSFFLFFFLNSCSYGFVGWWPVESLHRNVTLLASVFPYSQLICSLMENLTSMARHLIAPTVAMHPRKIHQKDQGSPYSPDKTRVHSFFFRRKIVLRKLPCPKVIEQIGFHFKWKMDGRKLESLRCKLSIRKHISIAFTRK